MGKKRHLEGMVILLVFALVQDLVCKKEKLTLPCRGKGCLEDVEKQAWKMGRCSSDVAGLPCCASMSSHHETIWDPGHAFFSLSNGMDHG